MPLFGLVQHGPALVLEDRPRPGSATRQLDGAPLPAACAPNRENRDAWFRASSSLGLLSGGHAAGTRRTYTMPRSAGGQEPGGPERHPRTGQLRDREVVGHLPLPPHQQSTGSLHPREGALDHLATRTVAQPFSYGSFAPTTDRPLERMGVDQIVHLGKVIPLVETVSLSDPSGRSERSCIECAHDELAVAAIGGGRPESQGRSPPAAVEAPLHAELASVGRVGSGPLAPERSLRHRSVHRLPSPPDTGLLVVFAQGLGPEPEEHSGLRPLPEPGMDGARGSETSRKGAPRAAGEGALEDPLHAASVIDARTTAQRTGWMNRPEWGDSEPERIGERERRRDRWGGRHPRALSSR